VTELVQNLERVQINAPVPSDTKRIKVVHASGEVFDNIEQARKDLWDLFSLEAVILCGTESGNDDRQAMMRHDLEAEGYHAFLPGATDGWVALHKNFVGNATLSVRYDQVRESGAANHDPHPYAGAGVIEMAFTHPRLGQITVVGGGHYLTKGRYEGQAQEQFPNDPVHHREENKRLARAMANACIAGSEGKGISFFTADTNMVDKDDDVFFGKPLTTCWDELGKWPNTGHGNIDVIGTVNADSRVKLHDAYVLDDDRFPQNTDHFVVVAEYDIRKLKETQ
jgi:hypothetical protein